MDRYHLGRVLACTQFCRSLVGPALPVSGQRIIYFPLVSGVNIKILVREHDLITGDLTLENSLPKGFKIKANPLGFDVSAAVSQASYRSL